jgi:hypothetical protein
MLSVYRSAYPDLAFVAKLYEQNGDGEARRTLVDFMRVGDTAQDRRIVILLMARELGAGEPTGYSRARFLGRVLLIPHPIKEDPPTVSIHIDRELDGLVGEKVLKDEEADSIRVFARTPRSVGVLLTRWSRQAIPKAKGSRDDEWFQYFCDMVFLARSRAPEAFPLFLRGVAFKESDGCYRIELDILGGYTDEDPAKVDWDKWYQEWKAKGEDKLPEWRVPPPGGRRRAVGSAKKSVDTEGGKKAE